MNRVIVYTMLSDRGRPTGERVYRPKNEEDYQRVMDILEENPEYKLVREVRMQDIRENVAFYMTELIHQACEMEYLEQGDSEGLREIAGMLENWLCREENRA